MDNKVEAAQIGLLLLCSKTSSLNQDTRSVPPPWTCRRHRR